MTEMYSIPFQYEYYKPALPNSILLGNLLGHLILTFNSINSVNWNNQQSVIDFQVDQRLGILEVN